jgi:hypothetical protein
MVNIVLGLCIVGVIIVRQLTIRPVRGDSRMVLVLVLAGYGVAAIARTIRGHHVSAAVIGVLVASLLGAAALGGVRALTVRVWRDPDGRLMQRGTATTAALWIVSIAVHLAADAWLAKLSTIAGLGASTVAIYLAVTWGVQGTVLRLRAAAPTSPLLAAPLMPRVGSASPHQHVR